MIVWVTHCLALSAVHNAMISISGLTHAIGRVQDKLNRISHVFEKVVFTV